jgi:hypothetical protein
LLPKGSQSAPDFVINRELALGRATKMFQPTANADPDQIKPDADEELIVI